MTLDEPNPKILEYEGEALPWRAQSILVNRGLLPHIHSMLQYVFITTNISKWWPCSTLKRLAEVNKTLERYIYIMTVPTKPQRCIWWTLFIF